MPKLGTNTVIANDVLMNGDLDLFELRVEPFLFLEQGATMQWLILGCARQSEALSLISAAPCRLGCGF